MYKAIIVLLFVFSCSSGDDGGGDNGGGTVDPPKNVIPSNLSFNVEIIGSDSNNPNGDGLGVVKFSASAVDANNYSFRFGTGDTKNSSSGIVEYTYTDVGTNTYDVKVLAYSRTNNYIDAEKTITVYVKPQPDADLVNLLSGGSEKTWKVNAAYDGHFANGDSEDRYPSWYEAYAFDKNNFGMYDDEYTFKSDGTFSHKTNGNVYGKASYLTSSFGSSGQNPNTDGEIENYNLENYSTNYLAKKDDGLDIIEFSDKGFVGFYVGQSDYTIECSDGNNILLRSVDNQNTAWYVWLTSDEVSGISSKDMFTKLIWQDEFKYTGSPDPEKWHIEQRNQWYNNEKQATTDRLLNVKVEDDVLKIIARKEQEPYGGKDYTSSRIRTHKVSNFNEENPLDFTYGRVDIRAKMPSKGGTWPALWMLGSNYSASGNGLDWPYCGEIDILEHTGNNLNRVQATVHHPDNYGEGDTKVTYEYNDVSTEFHVYSVVWTPIAITFYVDNKPYHIVGNSCALPFNWDFNIILNVAMGGNMGGAIAEDFDFDILEVDYVRVYQD